MTYADILSAVRVSRSTVIVGYPATGKTTLADRLMRDCPRLAVYSTDDAYRHGEGVSDMALADALFYLKKNFDTMPFRGRSVLPDASQGGADGEQLAARPDNRVPVQRRNTGCSLRRGTARQKVCVYRRVLQGAGRVLEGVGGFGKKERHSALGFCDGITQPFSRNRRMSKETRGGARLGAGRPLTGRERGNFTTTLAPGTLEYLQNIHPNAGRLLDTLVTLYRVEHNHVTPEQVLAFIRESGL